MANVKNYTQAELEVLKYGQLREAARSHSIDMTGKKPADLVRDVLKAQKVAEGKGTPADPKAGQKAAAAAPKASPTPATPAAAPTPTKTATPDLEIAALKGRVEGLSGRIDKNDSDAGYFLKEIAYILGALTAMAKEIGFDLPAKEPATKGMAKAATTPAPAATPTPTKAKPAPVAAVEEEEDEDEEDAEEEEDEEEVIDVDAEELDAMSADQLRDLAKKIDAGVGEGTIPDAKNPGKLREAIRTFLSENAEKVVDDAPAPAAKKEKETPPAETREKKGATYEERTGLPEGIRKGGKVEVLLEDDETEEETWTPATITEVYQVEGEDGFQVDVVFEDDETAEGLDPSDTDIIRPLVEKKKKIVKK